MAKLKCKCGYTIWDTTDRLPYKAWFIRDQDLHVKDQIVADICTFIEACQAGKKTDWMKAYFGEQVDVEMPNDWIITEIQVRNEQTFEGWMYQCDDCGRIRITKPCSNNYVSFIPAGTKWRHIFRSSEFHKY